MSRQFALQSTSSGGSASAPASIEVKGIVKGDTFTYSASSSGASASAPGSGASTTAASIKVKRIVKGDTFASSADFRTAFERNMMVDGRQFRTDKRVSGGNAKLYRCTGAVIVAGVKGASGCPVLVRGCKRADNEWHVTEVTLEHRNCTGQAGEKKKRPSRKAMQQEVGALVNANHKITSPALVKTLQATCGVVMAERTANRMRAEILEGGDDAAKEEFAVLESYLAALERESAGTIVDCEWDEHGHFVRCFMMIGAAARMATEGVQQAFAMDATSFKEKWNGVFATLSFKDANNKLLHVATVVSAKEDVSCYTYLLTKAMESPMLRDILNNLNTTCFTDKHKGPDSAVPKLCPLTEDRRCVEDLLKLVGVVRPSERHHVYQAAKAATKAGFEKHVQELKKTNGKAYDKLVGTPHKSWANYAGRNNVIWDQTTSNMAELLNVIGAETRAKSVLGFLQDIALQTGRRLNDAATLKTTDTTALITPFATSIFSAELKRAEGLVASPTGGGGFMVYPQHNSFLNNRVNLRYGASPDDHVYDCTCGWCLRWKMPCRHVLAAAKASGAANRALELVYKGYSLADYRAAAADLNYRIVPPVWSDLTPNIEHLPPLDVKKPAGRTKREPRKRARIESNSEHNSSSSTHAVQNADIRRTGGAGAAAGGGGGSAGGSAGGGAVGVMDPSQGAVDLSQSVTDLSQGSSQGKQA